ncbi:MAG: hypothetical protein EHM72_15605 [Calditrichaeota bacterium]|nr:MAG: hypothetical protein EHM72_15605 [Calditrichota bacterium]
MTDPKSFYRELDALLATIRIERSQGNLLITVISLIERSFGDRLHIGGGRLYELRGGEFILIHPELPSSLLATQISRENQAIRLAAKHRSYIYDQPDLNRPFYSADFSAIPNTTAVWIHNQGRHWLMVFELLPGWEREEISLLLNSVRLSLNYRLFADIIGSSLEQAAEIHKSLFPGNPIKIPGYEIHAISKSAEMIGGDFFDYYDNEDGTFGLSIGDASGHGIPAALLVRDVVIGLRMGLALDLRLVHTLKKLNAVIQRSTYSTCFVSLFVGELENDGHLFYTNAGHPGPILVTSNSAVTLDATGIALGFFPELKVARSHVHIPPDGVLVMYTDGIIERESAPEIQFGVDSLKQLVIKNRRASAQELCQTIIQQVHEYGQKSSWQDDATVVVIKRMPF